MQNSVMKYITSIGQKTGTLKKSKNVHIRPMIVLFVIDSQNLNSGRRRMNGRNSSLLRVGKLGPSSANKKNGTVYLKQIFNTRNLIIVFYGLVFIIIIENVYLRNQAYKFIYY